MSPANVIEVSQVKQVAKLLILHVLQLDVGWHGIQVEGWLIFIANPIGHGQSPALRIKDISHVKQVPILFESQVRQFFVHCMHIDLLLIS